MKTYSFIKKANVEAGIENPWLAINVDRIETLNVSDCYDSNGQQIDPYSAGDTLSLLTTAAVEVANKVSKEEDYDFTYNINEIISAPDGGPYDEIVKALEKSELIESTDYAFEKQTVKGFNYWNGHNWRTVAVESDNNEPEYELCDDQDLIDRMNKAIEECEYSSECRGFTYFEHPDFSIKKSAFQEDFEDYQIFED